MSDASSKPDRLTDPVRQDPKPWDIVGGRRGLRLTTLAMMGWRALAGEAAVLIVAEVLLRVSLPLIPCAVIIAVGVALNVALRLFSDRAAPDGVGAIVLCLAIIQVAALL